MLLRALALEPVDTPAIAKCLRIRPFSEKNPSPEANSQAA